MNKYLLIVTFLMFVFLSFNNFAQTEKICDSKITNVVVYQQGATISREAKCNLQKGKTNLIFKGLSSKINPDNLHVKSNNEDVMIISVTHNIDYLNKSKASKQIEELERKRKNIIDSIKILSGTKVVYTQEREMILTNKSIGGDNGVNINDLQSAANFFRSRLIEIEYKNQQIENNSLRIKESLIEISKQLLELNTKIDLPTSLINIEVSTEKTCDVTLGIEYLIFDAGWNPSYDIRIQDINNPLNLTYNANVFQNTEEDWDNVKLTLSTGNPTISNTKPVLENYYLTFNNFYSNTNSYSRQNQLIVNQKFTGEIKGKVTEIETGEPLYGCNIMLKGTNIGTVTDLDGNYKIEVPSKNETLIFSFIGFETQEIFTNSTFINVKMKPEHVSLDEVVVVGNTTDNESFQGRRYVDKPQKKEIIPIAVNKQNTTTEFRIDIPYSIPSNNKEYKVSMVKYEIPVIYNYSCIPKLNKFVYLVARIPDWTKFNLLNASANIFFKGTYQGETFIDIASLSDTLDISIGRDEDIIIQREIEKDFTSASIVSGYKKELKGWNIMAKNNKEIPLKLIIEDQFPISKTEEIKVDLIESSGAKIDKETGKLIWNVELQPKEKKNYLLKYSVKYPKEKKVIVD